LTFVTCLSHISHVCSAFSMPMSVALTPEARPTFIGVHHVCCRSVVLRRSPLLHASHLLSLSLVNSINSSTTSVACQQHSQIDPCLVSVAFLSCLPRVSCTNNLNCILCLSLFYYLCCLSESLTNWTSAMCLSQVCWSCRLIVAITT
jgi:hypothetical protein